MTGKTIQQPLFEKILQLPTDKIMEVEDFVDFLLTRKIDRQLTREAQQLSEPVFAAVWDNTDDAEYDNL
jgi:hypothetical protein